MLGVLTVSQNYHERIVIRTFLDQLKIDKNIIKVYFLLDNHVVGKEKSINDIGANDILYLNSTFSGRANHFGEKLYRWFKLSRYMHPNARYIGKIDDDVIFCLRHVYANILQVDQGSGLIYYGWQHQYDNGSNTEWQSVRTSMHKFRLDEFFIVVGHKLVSRIIERPYVGCMPHNCNSTIILNGNNTIFDWDYAGVSLGHWLSIYPDVRFYPMNHMFIYIHVTKFKMGKHRNDTERNSSFTYHQLAQPFCAHHWSYHKAHISEMLLFSKDLERYALNTSVDFTQSILKV